MERQQKRIGGGVRLFSIMMALVLIVGLMPITALGEDGAASAEGEGGAAVDVGAPAGDAVAVPADGGAPQDDNGAAAGEGAPDGGAFSASGDVPGADGVDGALLGEAAGVAADEGGIMVMGTKGLLLDVLNGDYAYVKSLTVGTVLDGAGPFDTSSDPGAVDYKDRDGNDENASNGTVRTFDTVTYNIDYATATSGEYDNIADGYLFYEFVLPVSDAKKAYFEAGSMGWMGANVTDLASVTGGANGYVTSTQTRAVNGTAQTCQVITGKRWLEGNSTNPYAVSAGSGTLNCVVYVGAMAKGDKIEPQFNAWMDYNKTAEHPCAEHNREEVASVVAPPTTVTAELRMNVELRQGSATHCNGTDDFDFTNVGNGLALNKDAGTVFGRIVCYGVTLQLYNDNAGRGLKGCEIPDGDDITLDVNLSAAYRKDADPTNLIPLSGQYTPLVWSYDALSSAAQPDGRDVSAFGLSYPVGGGPSNSENRLNATGVPVTGAGGCAWGGAWSASQSGATVSLTNSGYAINPNYFPNSAAGYAAYVNVYFDPTLGVRSTSIGCFSSAELFMVVPFGTGDDNLAAKYGSGTVQFTLTDAKLRATSASGTALQEAADNANQLNMRDDSITRTVYLSLPGTFTNLVSYGYQGGGYGADPNGKYPDSWGNGKDTAAVGQGIGISWGAGNQANGELANRLFGLNALLKFDDAALAVDDAQSIINVSTPDYNDPVNRRSYLYAAKADGTGWGSATLTKDQEMNAAVETDLVYYPSLAALKAAGKVCVGVLMEYRSDDPMRTYTEAYSKVMMNVREDVNLAGGVYQTCVSSTYWTQKEYQNAPNQTIPSRLDVQAGTATMPAALGTNIRGDYVKATYNADGQYTTGHIGGVTIGDSLYIVSYKASITKGVEQVQLNPATQSLDTKKSYDMDYGQRVADYALHPALTWNNGVNPAGEVKTRVVVTDTLPAGLTYLASSATVGGTYAPYKNSKGQYAYDHPGTVSGGTAAEPTVAETVDANGKKVQVLTWVFENVVVGQDMPAIHYSCTIGSTVDSEDVKNNDSLLNKASIKAEGDRREPTLGNGNYAEETIEVTKLNAVSLSKVADQAFNDPGSSIGYTLFYGNNGANAKTDDVIMDTMPHNKALQEGESYQPLDSHFDGQLLIESYKLDKSNATNADAWRLFYTTDAAASSTSATDYKNDADGTDRTAEIAAGSVVFDKGTPETSDDVTVSWTEAAIAADGTVTAMNGKAVTGIIVLGTIKSKETLSAHLTMRAPDAKAGSKFVNTLSEQGVEQPSNAYYVARSLEGVAWMDRNADGERATEEVMLSGVKVELLRLKAGGNAANGADYEPYTYTVGGAPKAATVATGKQLNMLTDEVSDYSSAGAGAYLFYGLPEGTFAVRFTDASFVKLTASPVDEGGNTEFTDLFDSDGVPTVSNGKLTQTLIADIAMPATSEMTEAFFNSAHHDSGFYLSPAAITVMKKDGNAPLEGVSFKLEQRKVDNEGNPVLDADLNQVWDTVQVGAALTNKTNDTDAAGKLVYAGLEPGDYRLTEVKTLPGLTLLADPVTVTLPYSRATSPTNPTPSYQENGNDYYLDVTYTIDNGQAFASPTTGGGGPIGSVLAGLVVMLAGLSAAAIAVRRRRAAHRVNPR